MEAHPRFLCFHTLCAVQVAKEQEGTEPHLCRQQQAQDPGTHSRGELVMPPG